MATPEEYIRAQNGAVRLAEKSLRDILAGLDMGDAIGVRDALGLVWVDLIGTYGDVTATLAADRFEELTGKPATMVRPVDPDRANARMRWALGPLFGDDGDALARLDLLADELVKQPGRSTIIRSSADQGIRYARVPTGAETCSFCLMLASRGAVYLSAESARTVSGKSLGGTDYRKLRKLGDTAERRAEMLAGRKTRASMKAAAGSKFHGRCDCRVEPVASQDDADRLAAEGYDPDAIYNRWQEALAAEKSAT